MPTKIISAINATPGTKLFGRNQSRVCFTVFLPDSQTECYLSDNANDQNMYYIKPGEIVFFSALEGHDTTKAWYLRSSVPTAQTALIYEEFVQPIVMEKLAEKGIDSVAGISVLIALAGLAG